jgi:uncharacterized protein (UPF0262 family)
MAGRPRQDGAEVRNRQLSVRWTSTEYDLIKVAKEQNGIRYLVDVPRIMTLRQIELEKVIGKSADNLEKVRRVAELASADEVLSLTLKQIKLQDAIGDGMKDVESVRRTLGLETVEDTLWALAKAQIEQMRSALERDVAE